MTNPGYADLQRWSEEVARDPGSPAFLPLARAYRRRGQREAALRLCLRGLERNPTNVEGHALLALLHLDAGERELASDEWATVLRLDPGNFEAHRGLGFYRLELEDFEGARRHLEQAAAARPDDPAVRDALALVRERLGRNGADRPQREPTAIFEPLLAEPAFLGALVLDLQGLVLAGTLQAGGARRAEALGAVVGDAIEEAVRTVEHLNLGPLGGILLEAEAATLHLSPLEGDLTLLVAVTRDAPMGWVLRTANRAGELAREYLERTP
jgi:tetratricopeptide (TPR) repeat protein